MARKRREDGEAHVLDVGTGAGLLAVLAARGGASSVVACDLHAGLAAVARRVCATGHQAVEMELFPVHQSSNT